MKRRFLVCGLLMFFGVGAAVALAGPPGAEPAALRTENRARELVSVFHPGGAAGALGELLEPLELLSQTVAAAILIGALMLRLRRDEAQMECIAGMLLKVAFIASLPFWKVWALEGGEAMSAVLGAPAVGGASLVLSAPAETAELSPLMRQLWLLGEQWGLEGSPMGDALEGTWDAGSKRDEEMLGKAWNWAKPASMEAQDPAEASWAAETNARRAGLVHGLVMGCAGAVQATFVGHHLAEVLRLLLFHAGCALAPFCIAGLGTQALQVQSLRTLLGLLGIAFWPLAWAVGNAASTAMLKGALQVAGWSCSSAMYPKLADEGLRTLALSAPALSWWMLSAVVVMTLGVCLWMVAVLFAGPWALHRLVAGGARLAGLSSAGPGQA